MVNSAEVRYRCAVDWALYYGAHHGKAEFWWEEAQSLLNAINEEENYGSDRTSSTHHS